jgi:hypothetical protein
MGTLNLLIHLLNFAAPAFGMAALMLAFTLVISRNRPTVVSGWVQLGLNFGVGLVALALGLWFFGRDGMMATYGALAVGVATSQWVITKSWRG